MHRGVTIGNPATRRPGMAVRFGRDLKLESHSQLTVPVPGVPVYRSAIRGFCRLGRDGMGEDEPPHRTTLMDTLRCGRLACCGL